MLLGRALLTISFQPLPFPAPQSLVLFGVHSMLGSIIILRQVS
jgi:hypothetical protein